MPGWSLLSRRVSDATQDLVIKFDASGNLRVKGSDAVRNFAVWRLLSGASGSLRAMGYDSVRIFAAFRFDCMLGSGFSDPSSTDAAERA